MSSLLSSSARSRRSDASRVFCSASRRFARLPLGDVETVVLAAVPVPVPVPAAVAIANASLSRACLRLYLSSLRCVSFLASCSSASRLVSAASLSSPSRSATTRRSRFGAPRSFAEVASSDARAATAASSNAASARRVSSLARAHAAASSFALDSASRLSRLSAAARSSTRRSSASRTARASSATVTRLSRARRVAVRVSRRLSMARSLASMVARSSASRRPCKPRRGGERSARARTSGARSSTTITAPIPLDDAPRCRPPAAS